MEQLTRVKDNAPDTWLTEKEFDFSAPLCLGGEPVLKSTA